MSTRSRHNHNFHQQKSSIHMSWKFGPNNRDLAYSWSWPRSGGEIFFSTVEWGNFFLRSRWKKNCSLKFSKFYRETPMLESLFKACVGYFFSNFMFSSNDSPSKTMKNVFLFHWKSSFRSRDIKIFVIFSLFFNIFQIQKGKWKWNNLCHKLSCIYLQI